MFQHLGTSLSLRRVDGHHVLDELAGLHRVLSHFVHGCILLDPTQQLILGLSFVWGRLREAHEGHDAKRPDVNLCIVRLFFEYFRCHVPVCSELVRQLLFDAGRDLGREAKVRQHDLAFLFTLD